MSDDQPPNNVFQFPGASTSDGSDASDRDEPFEVGAFLDKYGPSLYTPVADLNPQVRASMLHKFRQHRAIIDMLIGLIEAENAKDRESDR